MAPPDDHEHVLAAPNRVRLLAAKVISYAFAGAVLSLVVTVAIRSPAR